MKTMFRTHRLYFNGNPIEELEVIKTSEKTVWYKSECRKTDCRELLSTKWYEWHNTKDEAIAYLTEQYAFKVACCEASLQKAIEEQVKIMEMIK